MSFALDDYVEVADRIAEFYRRFPEGRLRADIVELTETKIVMRAYAYRTAEDMVPATGHSTLAIPGKTPYTRDAEVENCETSAIGRAIVMAGIPSKKVASADEVKAKVVAMPVKAAPRPAPVPAPAPPPRVAPDEPPLPPPPPIEEDGWAAVVAAAPQPAPHGGWKEGEVHEAGHRPLRARANGSLYCPTKLEDGRWCPWKTAEHPK